MDRWGKYHWKPDDEFYKEQPMRLIDDGELERGEIDDDVQQEQDWNTPRREKRERRPPDLVAQAALPIGKELFEYLCGTAGTGKTFLAKQLKETDPDGIELAATTGIAAVNLGEGTTIHALLRFFDTQSLRDNFRQGTLQSQLRKLRSAGLKRIIIDEVSMLSGEALSIITRAVHEINLKVGQADEDDVAAYAIDGEVDETKESTRAYKPKKNDWPIAITLVGDFGQLPPVPDKDPMTQKSIPVQYAFEYGSGEIWKSFYAKHIVKLEKIWRQDETELQFVQALHAVRRGDWVSALQFFTPDKFSDYTDENFDGTTIYAKNIEVDRHNALKLDALPGPKMTMAAIRTGKQRGDWKQIPDVLELKAGALVMLLANRREYADREDEKGYIVYANGDLGILESSATDTVGWRVRLHRTGQLVTVVPVTRENTIPLEPGRKQEIKDEIHQQAMKQLFGEDPWIVRRRKDNGEPITPAYLGSKDYDPANIHTVEVPWTLVTPGDVQRAVNDEVMSDDTATVDVDTITNHDYMNYLQFTENALSARITEDGKKEIIGTVTYMPMRAAYGCTVHKTQGLTLDRVQINIRDPFFKQPGMLFVALSRCRSAAGLRIVGNQKGFMERCKIDPRVQPWL